MKKDKAAGGQFRDLYLSHGNKKKGADSNDTDFATVQVPSVLPRFVEIPSEQKGEKTFILLEQIIEKRLREEVYDRLVQEILCRFDKRK